MSIIVKEGRSIEEVLSEEGVLATVISGVSMQPLLKEKRDMAVLMPVSGVLKKYDVALYKTGERYVLHRVIKVCPEKKLYIIRGDNTFHKELVPFSAVIAYLTSYNRDGKSKKCTDLSYKAYARIWNFLYPLRNLFRLAKGIVFKT